MTSKTKYDLEYYYNSETTSDKVVDANIVTVHKKATYHEQYVIPLDTNPATNWRISIDWNNGDNQLCVLRNNPPSVWLNMINPTAYSRYELVIVKPTKWDGNVIFGDGGPTKTNIDWPYGDSTNLNWPTPITNEMESGDHLHITFFYDGTKYIGIESKIYNPVGISANGYDCSFFLDRNMHTIHTNARSWGGNYFGQLGDNTTTDRRTPIVLFDNKNYNIISASRHTLGLDTMGKLWSWGNNGGGQLGDNTSGTGQCKSRPVAVCGNHTFCSISTGRAHSLAITHEGRSWAWGLNGYGRLGDNSLTERLTPVAVCGNHTFCHISSGHFNSLSIDLRGLVWGWGLNYTGQLGDNSITNRLTPVSILGSSKTFCSISAGASHSLGVDFRGQVWGWGNNYHGQLGDNSTIQRNTPVSIHGTKKTFCSISAAGDYSLGLDLMGQVWSWGNNSYGRLGDNSVDDKSIPVAVCGNHTFCHISSGYFNSTAIDYRGRVWMWGARINISSAYLWDVFPIYTPIRVCNF